jgi:GTPase SAR1 family protein
MNESKFTKDEEQIIIPLKIVFLGDEAVGKTSIIQRFLSKKFTDTHNSTIGLFNY